MVEREGQGVTRLGRWDAIARRRRRRRDHADLRTVVARDDVHGRPGAVPDPLAPARQAMARVRRRHGYEQRGIGDGAGQDRIERPGVHRDARGDAERVARQRTAGELAVLEFEDLHRLGIEAPRLQRCPDVLVPQLDDDLGREAFVGIARDDPECEAAVRNGDLHVDGEEGTTVVPAVVLGVLAQTHTFPVDTVLSRDGATVLHITPSLAVRIALLHHEVVTPPLSGVTLHTPVVRDAVLTRFRVAVPHRRDVAELVADDLRVPITEDRARVLVADVRGLRGVVVVVAADRVIVVLDRGVVVSWVGLPVVRASEEYKRDRQQDGPIHGSPNGPESSMGLRSQS